MWMHSCCNELHNGRCTVPSAHLHHGYSSGSGVPAPPWTGDCWCYYRWGKACPMTEAAVSLLHATELNQLHPTQTCTLIGATWKLGTADEHLLCIPGQVCAWSARYPALMSGLATYWIWPSAWSPPPQHSSHSPHTGWQGDPHLTASITWPDLLPSCPDQLPPEWSAHLLVSNHTHFPLRWARVLCPWQFQQAKCNGVSWFRNT